MTGPAADVLAAEWIKLRSVRSTRWTVLVSTVLTIAAGVWAAKSIVDHFSPAGLADIDPAETLLSGLYVTQVGFGVLGVLAIGSEYATGQIRTTFTAVPRRLRVLTAKAVAAGGAASAVGTAAALGAFASGRPILAGHGLHAGILDPGVPRALLSAGLFLGLVALVGLGFGAIIRHTAGAVAVVFGLVFVAPLVVQALPARWEDRIEPYLLPSLGRQMYALRPGTMSAGAATGWCAVYAAVALGLAAVLIARRDA